MTIKKKTIAESPDKTSFEDDDFYGIEKKRIAEEAQKAHRIHELEVHSHLTSMIPHYEDAEGDDRRRLLHLNNLLISRFEEPGMMYWNVFRNAPSEIRDYADIFGNDFAESDQHSIIEFLEQKKREAGSMVEMGFDEDGEEDVPVLSKDDDEEESEEDATTEEEE